MAQLSTHAHLDQACLPVAGRCGAPCAFVGTPACGSAHRRAPVAGRSHGADCPARASTSGAAYPQPASPTRTLPRSTLGQTGSGVILAAQLRCQAQFAAVHGACFGYRHSWLCVHQASGAICGQARGHAGCCSRPVRLDSQGCPGADQTTPSTASTRGGWRTFTAGTAPGLGRRANSSARRPSPRRWRACTLTLGAGGACPSRLKSSCCTAPPRWPDRETAPVRSQATACSAGSLRQTDGGLAAEPQRLRDPGRVYQRAELLGGDQVLGAGVSRARAFASRLISGTRAEPRPFYWINRLRLTDWHWAGRFFCHFGGANTPLANQVPY